MVVMDDPLEALHGVSASTGLSTRVANVVRATALKGDAARIASKDKSDRATVEQAIDPRTRMVGAEGGGCREGLGRGLRDEPRTTTFRGNRNGL